MNGRDIDVVEALEIRAERGRTAGGRAVLDAARRRPLESAADASDEHRLSDLGSGRPRGAVLVAATAVLCAVVVGALALAVRQDASERVDTGGVAPSAAPDLTAPGWHALTPLLVPPNRGPHGDMPTIWTGREVVVPAGLLDGGGNIAETLAFDPTTGTTRLLPAPPRALDGNSAYVLSAWTGREIVLAADSDRATTPAEEGATQLAFALDPVAGTWRPITRPPQRLEGLVWAGDELWGWTWQRAVFSWSPQADRWTPLAPDDPAAPVGGSGPRGSVEWTGRELLILSRSEVLAFEPSRGWRRIPGDPTFESHAMTYQPADDSIVAVGFWSTGPKSKRAGLARLDLASGTWNEIAAPPGIKTIDRVAALSAGLAVWSDVGVERADGSDPRPGGFVQDTASGAWTRLPELPTTVYTAGAVAAGDRLLVWGQPSRDQSPPPTELRAAIWVP